MTPLPFTWPAVVPIFIAFYWAVRAELPFLRRARTVRDLRVDRHSSRVILVAGAGGALLAIVLALTARSYAIGPFRLPLFLSGLVVIVCSGLLRRHCFRTLGASFTYDVRVQPHQTVVDRGAYRFVRHPSYTGGLLLSAGIGLSLTNWLSLAAAVVPLAIAYAYRIRVEERALVQTIGAPYSDYMKRTRRLIPFVL